ncbi:hypothetical protein ES288_D05G147900v1 [Gossypium darwinii]|uniref:Uncharacterized protein n=1 Tax=Gossypium darwinii TaxID=34276 RepID=A0A5D2CFL2_GOSDA|nr:hypothetical protein ES288_D05G147900v1 [Gossypium darwinii]
MWMWSVEAAKSESNKAKKYFRMEFVDKEQEDTCKDLDFGALETDLSWNQPNTVHLCHSNCIWFFSPSNSRLR